MSETEENHPRQTTPLWLAYVLLLLTALFWSGTTIVGRAATGEISPFSLTFWRWLVAFLVFIPFGFRPFWAQRAIYIKYWRRMIGFSFFGVVGFTIPFFLGLQHTSAINGSLLQAAGPVIIVLTSLILLRIRLSTIEVVGTILAIVGSMLIVLHGDIAEISTLEFGLGDIFIVLSMLSWAIYTVTLRWKPAGLDSVGFIFVLAALSVPMILPFYLWELAQGLIFTPSPGNIGLILYSSVFASVIAYLCWNKSVEVVGPNVAGFSHYLIPVFGTIMSVVILGEIIEDYHYVAMVLIFTGLYLTTKNRAH
jgi:drug/metabolite transporter (DMT)-like permease